MPFLLNVNIYKINKMAKAVNLHSHSDFLQLFYLNPICRLFHFSTFDEWVFCECESQGCGFGLQWTLNMVNATNIDKSVFIAFDSYRSMYDYYTYIWQRRTKWTITMATPTKKWRERGTRKNSFVSIKRLNIFHQYLSIYIVVDAPFHLNICVVIDHIIVYCR